MAHAQPVAMSVMMGAPRGTGGALVPYTKLTDLPDSVRDHLPKHAQEIYQAAYNSAWEEYGHDEERAHRVACSAVKRDYEKDEDSGDWKKKDS
jgi:cation transport regulator